MRYKTKRLIVYAGHLLTWPCGLFSFLGYRLFNTERPFEFFARLLSLIPGLTGQYIRTSFYMQTLEQCHYDLVVGFCSWFAHRSARVGRSVVIGSFSIIGTATLADNVLVSSRVSILSGKYQHARPGEAPVDNFRNLLKRVHIGESSWLGEGSIIMADVGTECAVSAGSIVTKPMPDHSIAIGNPARFLKLGEKDGAVQS